MFRSIRWRLVTSTILITLLTASLIGILALTLLQRSIKQQEIADLTANAEGLARQALPLIAPTVNATELDSLVRAASFLGDAQVRILDAGHHELANSGLAAETDTVLWITGSSHGVLPSGSSYDLPGLPFVVFPDAPDSSSTLPAWRRYPGNTGVIIVRRTEHVWGGRFVVDDRYQIPLGSTSGAPESSQTTADEPAAPAPFQDGTPAMAQRVVTVPIGDASDPSGYVEISKSTAMGHQALTTARGAFLIAAVGALSLAAVVGLVVSKKLTAPIRSLTEVANRMADGDLAARAPAGGRDETGQLSRQFNQMADQLQASFAELEAERDTLRRFMADASHELRTPITALRTFNELLRDGAVEDAITRDEFLAESAVQIDRLSWITSHLLDLARLDAGLTALEMAPCAPGAVLEEAIAPFRLSAREKGLTLNVATSIPKMTLTCDRARVVLALSNLLDNAIKFTPSGGVVTLGAEPVAGGAPSIEGGPPAEGIRFWVQDTGPGIPAEEQTHVFERFFRGAAAEGQVQGSGLGLAIVKAVAESHGGRAAVESTVGAGSRFSLEIPITPPGRESACPTL